MPNPESPTPNPAPRARSTICPYCGARSRSLARCDVCRGPFDPLSRQATQNAMGPWYVRDEERPHRPGCSYETLVQMIERGQVTPETVIRGPSSLQFWTVARWCPGVAHLLGTCHSCGATVDRVDPACPRCGASFRAPADRQSLGLGQVRFIPGRTGGEATGVEAQPSTPAAAAHAASRLDAEAPLDPALLRTRRELAVARRWSQFLVATVIVLALALTVVLVLPALDLEAGPLSAMLGKAPTPGEVSAPDLHEAPLSILPVPGNPTRPAEEAAPPAAAPGPATPREDPSPVGTPNDGAGPVVDEDGLREADRQIAPEWASLRRLR